MKDSSIQSKSFVFTQQLSPRDLRKNRFGLTLFCISQGVPYFLLINVRYMIAGNLVPPTLNFWLGGFIPTIALLLGLLPLGLAHRSLHQNQMKKFRNEMSLILVLCAIAVITLMIPLWYHTLDALSRFGEIYLTTMGVASFYTVITFIVVAGVRIRAHKGFIHKEAPWGLEAATWVYSFNSFAWLILFIVLYFM